MYVLVRILRFAKLFTLARFSNEPVLYIDSLTVGGAYGMAEIKPFLRKPLYIKQHCAYNSLIAPKIHYALATYKLASFIQAK